MNIDRVQPGMQAPLQRPERRGPAFDATISDEGVRFAPAASPAPQLTSSPELQALLSPAEVQALAQHFAPGSGGVAGQGVQRAPGAYNLRGAAVQQAPAALVGRLVDTLG